MRKRRARDRGEEEDPEDGWLCLSDFSSMALSFSGIAEGRNKEEGIRQEQKREENLR